MNDCFTLEGTSSRVSQLLREKEEKRAQERRRHLLCLIVAFLQERGHVNSVETLFKEAQLPRDIQVCENIDLETIIIEYTDYYYAKFNKYPKFCRKADSTATGSLVNVFEAKKERALKKHSKHEDNKIRDESVTGKGKALQKAVNSTSKDEVNFEMTIVPIFPMENGYRVPAKRVSGEYVDNERILKPIEGLYPSGSEWREIADTISREIVSKNLNVHWDDLKGLRDSKERLKETIVYPMKYPSLFNGKFGPSKGILLYGPPGTGKTMLAKAVATECQCTFFNITASSMVSKWRGDSEKYIRVLLDLACYYAPTIIFIDEIDWIATKSDNNSQSSEPARRFRAELLGRLDGLLSTERTHVILLGATNLPWNIDAALLRRLEIRIFVELPDQLTRLQILQFYIDKQLHNAKEILKLLDDTEGYSCADLKLLCKEAWMMQLRRFWRPLENNEIKLNEIKMDYIADLSYLYNALRLVKPTVKHMTNEYIEWKQNLVISK